MYLPTIAATPTLPHFTTSDHHITDLPAYIPHLLHLILPGQIATLHTYLSCIVRAYLPYICLPVPLYCIHLIMFLLLLIKLMLMFAYRCTTMAFKLGRVVAVLSVSDRS